MIKTAAQIWSNPYKTKLWMFSANSDTFCKKELELWDLIAGYGPDGCSDTNPKLSRKIHRSRATIKRYLRNLRGRCLVNVVPGWAELKGGQFIKTLRYRRIIAIPWPTKASWISGSLKKMAEGVGSKMSHYSRRRDKISIRVAQRSQLDAVLDESTLPSRNGSSELVQDSKS